MMDTNTDFDIPPSPNADLDIPPWPSPVAVTAQAPSTRVVLRRWKGPISNVIAAMPDRAGADPAHCQVFFADGRIEDVDYAFMIKSTTRVDMRDHDVIDLLASLKTAGISAHIVFAVSRPRK